MRRLFGLTVVGFALSFAWSVPQQGRAQGKPEGAQAPKQSRPNGTSSGPGYQSDYRYWPGTPGYPYMMNPYGPYPGMYQPYGGSAPYGYQPYGGTIGYGGMGYGGAMGYGGGMGYDGAMGYGGYSPYGMGDTSPVPTSQAEVAIYDNYFEPSTVYVTPGGTIRWTNQSKHAHTVTDLAGLWGSKDIRPGQSYTFTLKNALNHHYYCSHCPLEMNGSIVVRPRRPMPPQGQGQGQGGYTNQGY